MRSIVGLSLVIATAFSLAAAAGEKEPAAEKKKKTSLTTKVLSVSSDGKTVKLAAGTAAGVKKDFPFLVKRGPEEVAWLSVTVAAKDTSTAKVISGGPVKAGDLAVNAFKIGKVTWYRPERRLEIHGRVSLEDGPLEYLAVLKGGKEYESILSFDCSAIDVNLVLILSGYRRIREGVKKLGDPNVPKGDPLYLHVEWIEEKDGKKVAKRVRAEDLLYNQYTKKSMRRTAWVFSGSKFVNDPDDPKKRYFMAQVERKLVAVFRDPAAIFNCPLDTGDEDVFYVVNKKALPTGKNPDWACPRHDGTIFKKAGKCTVMVKRGDDDDDDKEEPCGLKFRPLGHRVKLIMSPAPMSALDPKNLKDGRHLFKSTGEANPPADRKPVPVPVPKRDGDDDGDAPKSEKKDRGK